MAEGLLKHLLPPPLRDSVRILSSGTHAVDGMPASDEAIEVMAEKSIDINDFRSRSLSTGLVASSDIVFVMEEHHRLELIERYPGQRDNVFLLRTFDRKHRPLHTGITDPFGRGLSEYRACRDDIESEIRRILPRLLELAYQGRP